MTLANCVQHPANWAMVRRYSMWEANTQSGFYRAQCDPFKCLESSSEARHEQHQYLVPAVQILTRTTWSWGFTATQQGIRSESVVISVWNNSAVFVLKYAWDLCRMVTDSVYKSLEQQKICKWWITLTYREVDHTWLLCTLENATTKKMLNSNIWPADTADISSWGSYEWTTISLSHLTHVWEFIVEWQRGSLTDRPNMCIWSFLQDEDEVCFPRQYIYIRPKRLLLFLTNSTHVMD